LAALCADGSDHGNAATGLLAALCADGSDHGNGAADVLADVLSPHGRNTLLAPPQEEARAPRRTESAPRPNDRLWSSRRPGRRVSLPQMAERNRGEEPLSSEEMIEEFRAGYAAPESQDAAPEVRPVPTAEPVPAAAPTPAPLPPGGPTPRPSAESRRRAAVSFAIALFVLGLGVAIALARGN
jgi:hypothetical protein